MNGMVFLICLLNFAIFWIGFWAGHKEGKNESWSEFQSLVTLVVVVVWFGCTLASIARMVTNDLNLSEPPTAESPAQ